MFYCTIFKNSTKQDNYLYKVEVDVFDERKNGNKIKHMLYSNGFKKVGPFAFALYIHNVGQFEHLLVLLEQIKPKAKYAVVRCVILKNKWSTQKVS